MFSPNTEAALTWNMGAEAGQPWPVVLSAETYRELVSAARQWDALRSGPSSRDATVVLRTQQDGSMRIDAA